MKRGVGWLLVACGCACASAWGQTNGIFADFSTSMGDFTVWLDHERAPRAVASFVGLATGEKAWADPAGNIWQGRKFYDGSLFHRVVKDANTNGIAIQGGGGASLSTDTNGVVTTNFANAGYYMLESVTNGLAHANGVISMANSGPNTDGSQFFITATNVPGWDGSYSVFGRVVTGMSVVTSIAAVAVQGSGSRPVEDIVLRNVVVRRVGAAADAFDPGSQGVPIVESGPMRHYASGTNQMLEFEIATQTEMLFRESEDLRTWESGDWGFNTGATIVWTTSVPRAELGDVYFFHLSRIRYPVPVTSPASQRGRTFTFRWDDPAIVYSATFSTNPLIPGAGWVQDGTNAPVARAIFIGDGWSRDAYLGRLFFMDDLAREYNYNLGFNPGQASNRFTGTWNNYGSSSRYPISGVFTVE